MQLVRFGFMRSGVRVLLKGKDGRRAVVMRRRWLCFSNL